MTNAPQHLDLSQELAATADWVDPDDPTYDGSRDAADRADDPDGWPDERDETTGAGPVLDNDGFTPASGQALAEDAHDHVGGAAGRKRHKDRHGSRREALAMGAESRQCRQREAEHASHQAHWSPLRNHVGTIMTTV